MSSPRRTTNFPASTIPRCCLSHDEVARSTGERPVSGSRTSRRCPTSRCRAPLAREMWARKHGTQVDGVIALDPVALSYLLDATGPVTLPSGDVLTRRERGAAAAQRGLPAVRPTRADRTQFFARPRPRRLRRPPPRSGRPDARSLAALAQAGDEHRLLLWSAHADDQAMLAGTTLAGGCRSPMRRRRASASTSTTAPARRWTTTRRSTPTVAWESCAVDSDGHGDRSSRQLKATVSSNDAPDPRDSRSTSLRADGSGSPAEREHRRVHLPAGGIGPGRSANMRTSTGFGGGLHNGRRVLSFDVLLAPGESVTATVSAESSSPTGADLVAQVTPTVNANVTAPISACL